MIMNKIVGMAALLLCLTGCVRDNDAIYYPVGDVDIERGGPALEVGEEDVLVARSFNEEDYVLDTIAQYPNDPTLVKLTFMIDLKKQQKDSKHTIYESETCKEVIKTFSLFKLFVFNQSFFYTNVKFEQF